MMRKSKVATFFLSFVPGVGHYYLGLMQRGLQFNLLFFGLLLIAILTEIGPLAVFFPVIWFYALFDAQQAASILHDGGQVEDKLLIPWTRLPMPRGYMTGVIFIVIGLMVFLFNNNFVSIDRYISYQDLLKVLISLFVMGFGVYLIVMAARNKREVIEATKPEGGKL